MAGPKNGVAPDIEQARTFLKLLDPEADAFTFQTFDDTPAKSRSLAKVWHGSLEDLAEPLTTLQQAGAGVFVTINATTLSGRRTAENIVAVRACFVDLDGTPLEPVMACEPSPHFTVESSPGRYHAYWRVRDMPLEQFKGAQKALAKRFNGDPAINDLPRVMRLPGFWHQKAEPFLSHVLWQGPSGEPCSAEQLLGESPPDSATDGTAGSAAGDYVEIAELVRQVMTAESFHEPLVCLAWRFIKIGMPAGYVMEALQGMLFAVEPHDERWQARFKEIDPAVASAAAKQLSPMWRIIAEWMCEEIPAQFVYPDDTVFAIMRGQGRRLSMREVHPSPALLQRMARASDAPLTVKGAVRVHALPAEYAKYRPTAWMEFIKDLPSQAEVEVASSAAQEEFEGQLTALFTTVVQIEWNGQRRHTLGAFARFYAGLQPGRWVRVGPYSCWARLTSTGLQIAFRPELAGPGQLRCRELSVLSQIKLTKLCNLYKVAAVGDNRITNDGEQIRVTVLNEQFVRSMALPDAGDDALATAMSARFRDREGGEKPN